MGPGSEKNVTCGPKVETTSIFHKNLWYDLLDKNVQLPFTSFRSFIEYIAI